MPISMSAAGDGVFVIELACPRGNAINNAFMEAALAALERARSEGARAIVLTAPGRTFCSGLDLVEFYEFDAIAMAAFVDAFDDFFARVFAFEVPIVAAVGGHAIAGGCVLAMAADYRIMASGGRSIGLTEAAIGLPLPAAVLEIARLAVPPPAWPEWLLEGRRFSAEEALRDGVIHRVCAETDVAAEAVAKAASLAKAAPGAVRAIKAALRGPALARIAATKVETRAMFVEHALGPEARARIGALRAGLMKKST
jgi:enoyl-CoA hydratase